MDTKNVVAAALLHEGTMSGNIGGGTGSVGIDGKGSSATVDVSLAAKILSPNSKLYGADQLGSALLTVLAKCFADNKYLMNKFVTQKQGGAVLALESLVSSYEQGRVLNKGYITRARTLEPWIALISTLYLNKDTLDELSKKDRRKTRIPGRQRRQTNAETFCRTLELLGSLAKTDLGRYDTTSLVQNITDSNKGALVYQSQHPHASNVHMYWNIEMPGVDRVKVGFSNHSELEDQCDWLQFFHEHPVDEHGLLHFRLKHQAKCRASSELDAEEVGEDLPVGMFIKTRTEMEWYGPDRKPDPDRNAEDGFWRVQIVEPETHKDSWASWKEHIMVPVDLEGLELKPWSERYTAKNFPGCGNNPPLAIPASRFTCLFHTDSSGTRWGYHMELRPCKEDEPNLAEPIYSAFDKLLYEHAGPGHKLEPESGDSSGYTQLVRRSTGRALGNLKVVRSSSTLESGIDVCFKVSIETESGLGVTFDGRSKNCMISLWADEEKTVPLKGIAAGTKNCSGEHGLTKFPTPNNGWYCSGCYEKTGRQTGVPKDTIFYGCRQCDVDFCESCMGYASYKDGSWAGVEDNDAPSFFPNVSEVWVAVVVPDGSNDSLFKFAIHEAFPPPTEWEKFLENGKEAKMFKPATDAKNLSQRFEVIKDQLGCWPDLEVADDVSPPFQLAGGQFITVTERRVYKGCVWLRIPAGTALFEGPAAEYSSSGLDEQVSGTSGFAGTAEGTLQKASGETTALRFTRLSIEEGVIEGEGENSSTGRPFEVGGQVDSDGVTFTMSLDYTDSGDETEAPLSVELNGTLGKSKTLEGTAVDPQDEEPGIFSLTLTASPQVQREIARPVTTEDLWAREYTADSGFPLLALKDAKTEIFPIEVPYSEALAVAFHPDTKLADGVDFIEILAPTDADSSLEGEAHLLPRTTGFFGQNTQAGQPPAFPVLEAPLVIPFSSCTIRLTTRSSAGTGFHLATRAVPKPADPFKEFRTPGAVQLSSTELNNETPVKCLAVEGSAKIIVAFDSACNFGSDKLLFYKTDPRSSDGEDSELVGDSSAYSGNLPGAEGRAPLSVDGGEVWVKLQGGESHDSPDSSWALIVADAERVANKQMKAQRRMSQIPHGNAELQPIFPFIDNRSGDVQSVRFDLPISTGKAYYEVVVGSESTASSFLVVGWCLEGASLEIERQSDPEAPHCIGLGSTKDSVGVGGVVWGNGLGRYYQDGKTENYSTLPFKAGDVIGVQIDMENHWMAVSVNGRDQDQIYDQNRSWKGAMMPAVSFSPKQSFTVNFGLDKFEHMPHSSHFSSIREKCQTSATGKTEIWNQVWAVWETANAANNIFEDFLAPEVGTYKQALTSILTRYRDNQSKLVKLGCQSDKLNFEDALKAGAPPQDAPVTSSRGRSLSRAMSIRSSATAMAMSGIDNFLKATGKLNQALEFVLRDETSIRLIDLNIMYPQDKDPMKPEEIKLYTKGSAVPLVKANVSTVLQRPRKELGHQLDAALVDLCVAQLTDRLMLPWVELIRSSNQDEESRDWTIPSMAIKDAPQHLNEDKLRARYADDGGAEEEKGEETFDEEDADDESRKEKKEKQDAKKRQEARERKIKYDRFEGEADFAQMFESAVSKDMIDSSPEVPLILSKTVRTLGTKYIKYHLKVEEEAKRDKKKAVLEQQADGDRDEFSTKAELKLLSMVQKSLNNLGVPAAVLSCLLICQKSTVHQYEGFRLANFCLQGMNKHQQGRFMAVMKDDITDPKVKGKARGIVGEVATTMDRFVREFPSLRGPAKLNRIEDMRLLLGFLQRLCDGQHTEAQDFLGTQRAVAGDTATAGAGAEAEEGRTLIELTVEVMQALQSDLSELLSWSIDTTQFIYILRLAQQTFAALSDFIQGPHPANQELLANADIMKAIANWSRLLVQLSEVNRTKLCAQLPSRSQLDNSGLQRFSGALGGVKKKVKELRRSEEYELYSMIKSAEEKLMVLMHSELEQNNNLKLYKRTLDLFKADNLAMQFRYHWKAALFKKSDLKKSSRFDRFRKSYRRCRDNKCFSKDKDDSSESGGRTESPFLEEFDVDKALRLAAIHSQSEQQEATEVAFSYYVIMETIIDFSVDKDQLGSDYAKLHNTFRTTWESSGWDQEYTVVPREESKHYAEYFGRIEVLGKDDELHRIYFPIPWDCREQMKNPLVKAARKDLLENVSRENPEEKLDNFLDRGLQIQSVIEHQHRILTLSRFRAIIRFLTLHERWWVLLAGALTLMINLTMLVNNQQYHEGSTEEHDYDDFYMDSNIHERVKFYGYFHVACAVVLFINYAVGTARVTINTGYKWRKMVSDGLISLPFGESAEVAFAAADALLPEASWSLFFIATDVMSLYYTCYLLFSFLGAFYYVAFFAFHVLDIAVRSTVMNYVIQAVAKNMAQVTSTLVLGIIFVYLFTVIALVEWGWDAYEFGDGAASWQKLGFAFLQNIDFGLRGAPVFKQEDDGSYIEYDWKIFIFDFAYNILIILIMVAIITGIIIDTFADMRQRQNEISDDMRNTCFICSLPREVFERHRIVFTNHLKRDHNMWSYLFYKMYLERKEDTELTGMEAYLKDQMRGQSIAYFPTKQALVLDAERKSNEMSDLKTQVTGLEATLAGLGEKIEGLSKKLGGSDEEQA
uniref:B30.2/SPRY domain-containing protein n=1 Tax=Heterosigma akashiwo TaxID=2829 RepID=A0A7S3XT53_HETAK